MSAQNGLVQRLGARRTGSYPATMSIMIERLLLIGADFNFLDADGRVKTSLRFATTPEVPTIGEWVRLEDADGNSCLALVEEVKSPVIAARPDFATWRHCDIRLGS